MFTVYFKDNPDFLDFNVNKDNVTFPNSYTKVATVDTTDLETAFRLTNSIEHYWGLNDDVTMFSKKAVRSSSVGDVFVDENDNKFVCLNSGWSKL